MTLSSIDPARCPLCGQANQCGMAAGRGTCWCFSQRIPNDVLEKILAAARDRACVCEPCALGRRDPSANLERMKDLVRRRG